MVNKFYFIKGGSERYLFDLKNLLETRGYEVIPFAMADEQNFKSNYSSYFVDHINYKFQSRIQKFLKAPKAFARMTYSIHARRKLEQLLSRTRIDVAHLHMIDHQISPSILHALRKFNVPVVQTIHQYKLVCPNYRLYIPQKGEICERCLSGNYFNSVIQRCHKESLFASAMVFLETTIHKWMNIYEKNVDYFIVPSGFMGNKLAQGGIPEKKIKSIYHFIDTKNYPLSWDYENYFVYYGRLSEEKGVFTLLKAMKCLPKANLKIIGDGPLKGDLENYARKNQLINVQFLGMKSGEELKPLVSKAMFVVLPSEWYENSPMVIYESFAMGKPVIGSKTGGITELIRDNVDGLLFEMGNVNELRDCIQYLLTHPQKIVEFGRNGRLRAESEFNPEKHLQEILNLYHSLTDKSIPDKNVTLESSHE